MRSFFHLSYTAQILLLTAIIEAVTLFFRFGLGLESTKHTASTVGRLTMGVRIHHGYAGLAMLLLLLLPNIRNGRLAGLFIVSGTSLLLSDIIHHALLYLITGSADLDIFYPAVKP